MVKAYVLNGLGIGCHEEVAHAFEKAGADAEIIHIRQLLSGEKDLFESQILNMSGGFLHGDILGGGMCAANELEHATVNGDDQSKIKDLLIKYAEEGNVIWGQCNGFQLLVKTGLLPGINDNSQSITLTHNDCGNYRVTPALHMVVKQHFAFKGIDEDLYLWCRHGEGKIQFYSEHGLISREDGEANRDAVNKSRVLLRYCDPVQRCPTETFPYNPNGSIDGIAGLVNHNGNIFGHMGHPEVSVYASRDPRWFAVKDQLRRQGIKAGQLGEKRLEGIGLKIFENVVRYVKNG